MSSNPWINGEVPFEDYWADARATAHNEAVFTIDPLGAPTPEQVAEVKASPGMRALHAVLMTIGLTVAGLVLMGAGIYIGATDPDTWTQLPFTPEPSGERAEPEEGAR